MFRLALSHTDDVATYGFNKQDLDLQLHNWWFIVMQPDVGSV